MTLEQAVAIVCRLGGGWGSDVLTSHAFYLATYRRAEAGIRQWSGEHKEADLRQLRAAAAVLDNHHGVGR